MIMILFSRRDSFGINLDQEYEHDQEYDRKINKSLKLHTEKKNATKTLRTQRFHQEKYKLCAALPASMIKEINYTEGISTTDLLARVIQDRNLS